MKKPTLTIKQIIFLVLYYGFAYHLPSKKNFLLGSISRSIRYFCCKHIFKKIGKRVNIERHAYFGSRVGIEIGDFSGIGRNAHIPNDTIIGDYVMMGPNCFILSNNHKCDRLDIPMAKQGNLPHKQTIIGSDVWIGRDVKMTPGRRISDGSIIAMGCILSKDFPPYSVVGGIPCKIIKSRIKTEE